MAEQDFEQLLATIQKINAEMQELTSKIARARQEMATLNDPGQREQIGRRIGGYQTSLINKSRRIEDLNAQSMTAMKNQNVYNSSSMSATEMEKRINLATLGVPLTTSEIMARGKETAQRVIKEQQQLLKNAQNSLAQSKVSEISTPAGFTPKNDADDDFSDMPGATGKTYKSEAARIRAEQIEAERKALQTLKDRVSSEAKYKQALDQAIKLGFSIDDLKKGIRRGTAGIEQLQFERIDEGGSIQRFDTFVNPSGRATPGISNQFRSFGQGVVRDIGELTKWSLALAAVYGPLQKLQELTQVMIQNQTQLAEATISVNSSFLDQNDIFDIAATQAEAAGEAITGVIDAFTQAYRATGGAGNQVERLATSQKLLSDSLILAKLSTLDQATAIDTLSAALRQSADSGETSNQALSSGTELLDKWVRVTKIANIDLASLATGFAVLGDAAEAAQISTDQLNGILAAIGETGLASGKELANTARALVAGFQSDQAQRAIEEVGVAFQDSSGQARPFLEIMKELSDLRISGVIDDTQFSKLTLALGGGTRRQAAFATFIENFARVQEVAAESARANGDAQAALEKQLETVATATAHLSNAFQELAQTLGTEGGFLSLITTGVNGLTGLVRIFDDLTSVLGKATPALLAFIAASVLLKSQGRGSIQDFIGTQGAKLYSPGNIGDLRQSIGLPPTSRDRFAGFVNTNILGTNAASGISQGLLTAALPAIMNFTNKEDRYGTEKGFANLAGGVLGGIAGSLAGPQGIAAGAIIGTAISEAFVNSTIARKTDIFGYEAPTFVEQGKSPGSSDDLDERLKEAESELYKSIGFGNESLGKFLTSNIDKESIDAQLEDLNKAIRDQDLDKAITLSKSLPLQFAGITEDTVRQAFKEQKDISVSPERVAYNSASPEAQRAYDEALAARLAQGDTGQNERTAFGNLLSDNKNLYSELLTGIKEQNKKSISEERISGDIKGAEYARRTQAVSGLDVKALQYYTALGNEVNSLTGGAEDAARQFEILGNVIVGGADEAIPQMTTIAGEISTLVNLLDDPALNEKRLEEMFGDTDTIDIANDKLEELRKTLANLIADSNQQVLLGRIDIPDIQGDINKPLIGKEETLVEQRTKQLQDNFYQGFLKLPEDMYNALQESFDSFAVPVKEFEDAVTGFKEITKTDQQFRQAAIAQLQEEGKLGSQGTNPFGIQQLDITSAQGANLQGTIDYFSQYLAQNFPQYEQNPEDFGVIFSDYVTDVLHGDNLAVKLALEKLVDINQKQLDGQYNIPDGATFWVPLTAAYYRPKNEGTGLGNLSGTVSGEEEITDTSALDANTAALIALNATLAERSAKIGFNNTPSQDMRAERKEKFLEDEYKRQYQVSPYSTNSGYIPPESKSSITNTDSFSAFESFIQALKESLKNLFTPIGNRPGYGIGAESGGPNLGGSRPQFSATQTPQAPPVNAKLDFKFDNTTTLLVDGRVLASVITPYLASDLLRLEASQGTITKRYVI